jgi:maleylpyruvate isomerase
MARTVRRAAGTVRRVDERTIDQHVAGCSAAHQRLLAHLDEVAADLATNAPSRLPDWTIGHVLTHLARHAESQHRVFEAAARGESAERYPGGLAGRAGDIEAGSGRAASEQIDDVRRWIWQLEGSWARCPAAGWTLVATSFGRPEPVADLPFRRWREVEIHHADLGLPGFTYDDWSPAYVRYELDRALMAWRANQPMGVSDLPAAALALAPARRLAWLVGRREVDGLPPVPQWF